MGTMLKYGSESAKQFYEMCVIAPEFATAHVNGDIHIHDMDFYTLTTTCSVSYTHLDVYKRQAHAHGPQKEQGDGRKNAPHQGLLHQNRAYAHDLSLIHI